MHHFPYNILDFASAALLALAASCRAANAGMPLMGAVSLGCLAGLVGPTLRDLLAGFFGPVITLSEGRYAACALAGALAGWGLAARRWADGVFFWSDALGLGLAATLGASYGLRMGISPLGSLLLGLAAGLVGSMARDLCLGDAPKAFEAEFYAAAAAVGCMLVAALGHMWGPEAMHVPAGVGLAAALRLLGRRRALARGMPE